MKKNASSFFSLNPLLAAAKRTALAALLFAPLAARSDTTVFNDTFNNGSTINSATPASPTASSTAYEVLANKGAGTGTALAANRLSFSCAGSASSALVEVQALFSQSPVVLNQPGDTLQLTVTFTNGYALTTPNSGQLQFGLYNSGQVKPYPGGGNILSSTTTAYNGYAQGWLGYVAVVKTNNGLNAISMRPSQPGNAGRNQDLTAGGATSSGYTNGTTVGSATSTLASTLTSGAVYTNVVTITMYGGDTNSLAITNSLYSNTGTLLTQYGCVATNANYVTNSFDSLAIGYYGVEAATAVMNISKISVTASITGSPRQRSTTPSNTDTVGICPSGSM